MPPIRLELTTPLYLGNTQRDWPAARYADADLGPPEYRQPKSGAPLPAELPAAGVAPGAPQSLADADVPVGSDYSIWTREQAEAFEFDPDSPQDRALLRAHGIVVESAPPKPTAEALQRAAIRRQVVSEVLDKDTLKSALREVMGSQQPAAAAPASAAKHMAITNELLSMYQRSREGHMRVSEKRAHDARIRELQAALWALSPDA